jgi:hypothetical protein
MRNGRSPASPTISMSKPKLRALYLAKLRPQHADQSVAGSSFVSIAGGFRGIDPLRAVNYVVAVGVE